MFFNPFISKGDISFCNWFESGKDLMTSSPDIYTLLRGRENWRAVILYIPPEQEDLKTMEDDAHSNPFDFSRTTSIGERIKESEIPLVRFTHMLVGFPPLGVKGFEEQYTYHDKDRNKDVYISKSELSDLEFAELQEEYGNGIHVSPVALSYSADDMRKHQEISKKYELLETPPKEILLIALRKKRKENEHRFVRKSWENNLESNSSEFWSRNNYPTICKFLVFDIVNEQHSAYYRELFKFWMAVLSISINSVPPSALQSYRLYNFDIDIEVKSLTRDLNRHANMLYHNLKNIDNFLSRTRFGELDSAPVFIREEAIPISLETYDSSLFTIDKKDFPMVKSKKSSEIIQLANRMDLVDASIKRTLKKNRRILDQATRSIRLKADGFFGLEHSLDEYQIEDLRQEIRSLENSIYNQEMRYIFDPEIFKKKISEKYKTLRSELTARYSRGVLLKIGGIIGLAFFMGFIPFLAGSFRIGMTNAIYGVILATGAILAAMSGGIIALLVMRSSLHRKISEVNSGLREEYLTTVDKCQKFGDYLADILSYLKAQSILFNYTEKEKSESSLIRKYLQHKSAHKKIFDHENDILESFGNHIEGAIADDTPVQFDPESPPAQNSYYNLEYAPETELLDFNDTGEKLTSPYSFTRKLRIERESIFEECLPEKST
jgi:hypothetical protein